MLVLCDGFVLVPCVGLCCFRVLVCVGLSWVHKVLSRGALGNPVFFKFFFFEIILDVFLIFEQFLRLLVEKHVF